ncbi:flavin reductase family protein [Devosia sp. YIM 151766]|uniref:flavin reductase family protein n=1 Tax=Devosia sp. YIM 151766 TaxID=3017325 RepID=UPI00255C5DEF|nr:flavin reductase family protein [Devosia sp. YIM 151766]WIY52974.1 flavin reductase family protein [Devosia sp. YIM 151766]
MLSNAISTDSPTTSDHLRLAMRNLAAGVCLLTANEGGVRHGLLVSSFTSVSLAPPIVLVCVNRTASSCAPIRRRGSFCVSILGHADRPIADRFADPHARERRFEAGQWVESANGNPLLASALATLDCTIFNAIEMGSHTVFFAAVDNASVAEQEKCPLLYFDSAFRSIV